MNQFEQGLNDAADGPVSFDHNDIARRVQSRRRKRFVGAGVAAVLAVVGVVAGIVVDLGDDDEQVETAEHPDGSITIDELVADRWIVVAYSDVTVGADPPPYVEFGEDGWFRAVDGCQTSSGTWDVSEARLDISVRSSVPSSRCNNSGDSVGLADLLAKNPLVDRFDEGPNTLRLSSGDDFLGFQRFDRMGEAPTEESVAGDWASLVDDGGYVSFDTDGSGTVALGDCSEGFEWALDDDRLLIYGVSGDGLSCSDGTGVLGSPLTMLTSDPRVRHEGSWLLLSSDLGVERLVTQETDLDPTPTTTVLPDYVVASPEGITLHRSEGQATEIVNAETAVAFAVGADLVVYQTAAAGPSATYPPNPEGEPVVWTPEGQQTLPVESNAVRVRLLDARVLDGRPVALVAQVMGGAGPDDTYEELVLFDLETLDRAPVTAREAWESGHYDARILPDGDIIGLFFSEALTLMARWTPGSADALWTVELGTETRPLLGRSEGQITVLTARSDDNLDQVIGYSVFDPDGSLQGETEVRIADPDDELGAGLFCSDWDDDFRLICGRGDGPPILVDADTGSFEHLEGSAGGYPTLVRPR